MSLITIKGMEFFAYHGCFKEEQIIGTKFFVDLYIESNTIEAEETDKLSKTINYQTVYLLVKNEMEIKSKLLEHVGRRILKAVKKEFPNINSVKVKISKMNPPLGGKINSVSLTLSS
jgi:dihydroneopterin aldolase